MISKWFNQSLVCVSIKPTFLSEDSVSFGDIVVSSQKSKMLFLSNISHNMVRFEWVLPQQSNQPQASAHTKSFECVFPSLLTQTLIVY